MLTFSALRVKHEWARAWRNSAFVAIMCTLVQPEEAVLITMSVELTEREKLRLSALEQMRLGAIQYTQSSTEQDTYVPHLTLKGFKKINPKNSPKSSKVL